jgi:hypothetical protein
MSSTTNVQNLLTNVFRPTFVFANGVYQTKLELTNIDSVSANTVYGFSGSFGDASGNVYIGVEAGNPYTILATSANSNNTFVGKQAGQSTTGLVNSVLIGYRAGATSTTTSSNSVSIGATSKSAGNSNVFIGYAAGTSTGSNNIFIGPGVTNGGSAASNKLLIGSGASAALMVGDLTNNRLGINLSSLSTTAPSLSLDVNGYTRIGTNANGGLGINMVPGNYALDVTGAQRIQDGVGTMIFTGGNLGVNNVGVAAYTLDVTGDQRISNASGSMIFTGGNLTVTGGNLTASNATGSLRLVGNKVGINTTPTTYSLEVSGTQQIDDGSGTLTFTGGIQTSTGGFRSVSGTYTSLGNETFLHTLGSWKIGNVLIAVRVSDNTQYVSSLYLCTNATTPSIVLMSGVSNAAITNYPSLTIQGNGSSIQLSNSGTTTPGAIYTYSITYFPTP